MELLFVHTYYAFLHCVAGINNYDREDANSSPFLIEKKMDINWFLNIKLTNYLHIFDFFIKVFQMN